MICRVQASTPSGPVFAARIIGYGSAIYVSAKNMRFSSKNRWKISINEANIVMRVRANFRVFSWFPGGSKNPARILLHNALSTVHGKGGLGL
jgi:hypothetical protein